MNSFNSNLLDQVRDRFAQIDTCDQQGKRIFFENAGGALTLKSVVECSTHYAAIPDNQGRANVASHELVRVINQAKADMASFMNASDGQFFVGESGTELLFRLVSNACLGTEPGGQVLGSTLEHPATRSACTRWSRIAQHEYILVEHDNSTGSIEPAAYTAAVTENTRVATIIHTSPVTGMGVNLAAIASEIRKVSPACIIIVDGIQHAAHGAIDLASYDVDGYVVSPYKVFSRHGYGLAWISPRLAKLPHDELVGGPEENWELGTRDTGSYATFSKVVEYFDWLGGEVSNQTDPRQRFIAAGKAIHHQEKALTHAMINGVDGQPGLASLSGMNIIGGTDNPYREGLVAFWIDGIPSEQIVEDLNASGIRTHLRKADHYSGNILTPLGQPNCVRVSVCHYNTLAEVKDFLIAMRKISSKS